MGGLLLGVGLVWIGSEGGVGLEDQCLGEVGKCPGGLLLLLGCHHGSQRGGVEVPAGKLCLLKSEPCHG